MAFPSSPTNGQVANVGGITYIYNSTKGAWVRTPSTGANLTANSLAITSGATSTSTTTGALLVTGGAGIGGTLSAGQLNSAANLLAQGGTFNSLQVNGTSTVNGNENVTGVLNVTGNVLGAAATFNTIVSSTVPAATADNTTVPTTSWVRDQGGFQSVITYTNTTFAFANTSATFPAWVTKVKVTTVGGGGAGGGNPATIGVVGAGGGGGGACISYFAVVPGSQYWANVGAGGVSVINAAGGAGNISTFTISGTLFHQATGGGGGAVGVAATNVVGGVGGSASGGNVNLPGSCGGTANYHSATAGQSSSGVGAPGHLGMGGAVGVRATAAGSLAGVIGGNVGAGGSGSAGGATTATTNLGGRGGGGIIIVEY